MVPQGSSLIDTKYFEDLTQSVNNVQTCEELQALAAQAFASIDAAKAAIQLELEKIQPMLALLQGPSANLGQIVTYLNSLIANLITPIVKPSITYNLQLTATLAALASLASAVQDAASRIGSCTVPGP